MTFKNGFKRIGYLFQKAEGEDWSETRYCSEQPGRRGLVKLGGGRKGGPCTMSCQKTKQILLNVISAVFMYLVCAGGGEAGECAANTKLREQISPNQSGSSGTRVTSFLFP